VEKIKSGLIVMGDLPRWKNGLIVMGDLPRKKDGLIVMGDLPRWKKERVISLYWVTYPGGRMTSL
jgi:hypothetical protein